MHWGRLIGMPREQEQISNSPKTLVEKEGFLRKSKRHIIQLLAALLYNLNVPGFVTGTIYKGPTKALCAPGLNCYSCPGAVLACPIGSLSASLNDLDRKLPFYIVGTLLAFGAIFGRTICGWACPFGLLQDLLDKIPLPKLAKNKVTRRLTFVKYLMLIVLVLAVPFMYWLTTSVAYPAFCGWVCPAGTLEAGIPLVVANDSLRMFLGSLFSWKVGILIAFLITCVFVYRPFCRFICPLGAILSFFNRFSLLRYRVDHLRCTNCGDCVRSCKVDVAKVSDRECIQCGSCAKQCQNSAIAFSLSKRDLSNKDNQILENEGSNEKS